MPHPPVFARRPTAAPWGAYRQIGRRALAISWSRPRQVGRGPGGDGASCSVATRRPVPIGLARPVRPVRPDRGVGLLVLVVLGRLLDLGGDLGLERAQQVPGSGAPGRADGG